MKLNNYCDVTLDIKEIINNCKVIVIAVPAKVFKSTALKLKKLKINRDTILLSATKGITTNGIARPSEILNKYFPKNPKAVLSGPNIALDVIKNVPIISVIACKKIKYAKLLQELISTDNFRIYTNDDVSGVEIAGALKNVIAIAAGISDGLGFSISTKAALISRGLVEIGKISVCEGGRPMTLLGAAGIGDLIATSCSKDSRNYKVGYALAKGKKIKEILAELGQVAEGVETVKSMIRLAKKHSVSVPIASGVYEVIYKNKSPKVVLKNLLKRPLPASEFNF